MAQRAMLNLNHTHTLRHAYSHEMSKRIDAVRGAPDSHMVAGLMQRTEYHLTLARKEAPRAYVGASAVGDVCSRRVQYDVWRGFWSDDESVPMPPEHDKASLYNFARGHAGEEVVREWMEGAGWRMARVRPGFSCADGQFRGHTDGLVIDDDGDHIWEHKTVGDKSFRALWRNGLVKARPEYADQVALYQYYAATDFPALFTALNADTCELYFERIAFDPRRCQEASDRAVKIIQALRARELLPRVGEADSFPCGWRDKETGQMTGCRWRKVCHDIG